MKGPLYDDQLNGNNFVCPCILFALSIPHHQPPVTSQATLGQPPSQSAARLAGWVYQSLCSCIGLQIHSQTGWDINILWLSKRPRSTVVRSGWAQKNPNFSMNLIHFHWGSCCGPGQCVMETWLNLAKICAAHKMPCPGLCNVIDMRAQVQREKNVGEE